MAVFGVVVVARAIEVAGHQADRIKAVLQAQRRTMLQPSDLGHRTLLTGGFQLAA